ncbi:MAG: hypothetical protein AB1546_02515 [bacterium]
MIGRVDGAPPDMYAVVLAKHLNNLKITAEVVFNTMRLNQEQRNVAEATPYEQNFEMVNLAL